MATVLGLAMKITADASGLGRSLTPVERNLQRLGEQASASAALFDRFLGSTSGASAAQRQVATDIAFLTSALKTGQVTAQEFAKEFEAIQQAARATSEAFAEGARITQANLTADERRTQELRKLVDLLSLGAISQETYNRAVAEASGANAATAEAAARFAKFSADQERLRAEAIAEGARVAQSVATQEERRAQELARLSALLKQGAIDEQTYSRAVSIASGEQAAAAAIEQSRERVLEEGARITQQYLTIEERRASQLANLDSLFQQGAISQATYVRASADALGINEQAARAEQERASFASRAAQLQDQARTPLQRYDAEVQELVTHLNANNLSQAQFNTLLGDATQRFVRAESAAKGYDAAVDVAGKNGNLAFNELAGTLAILPGPIGNVAGRLSGIASAAEGLNRVFANGGGIGQFGAALGGLLNPTTLALGALAGLGAGAVAVGRNLVQLEGEVERLGQLADRLGVSFGFIQVLETAANQTGTSVEALGGSFTKFLRTVNDAREGGENAAAAFKTLGLSTEDVRSADPERLFTQSAEAIAKIADPAKRAATAVALFGKSGAELLPVFRQLGAAAADLERIGGALTDDQRAQIDAFGDSMDRLGVASQGLKRQLTANFAGIGKTVADNTAEAIGGLNRFIRDLDDVASDKTWLGFQKSAERLKFDREIIASREQVAKSLQEGRTNAAIAELVTSLSLAGDGTIRLSGDLEKAQQQAAALGNDGTKAFLAFVKSLEDVAAAAEGAGLSEEQLARAVANSRQDFEQQIQMLSREADAQKQAADVAKKAAEDRLRATERLIEADRQRADAFMRQAGIGQENEAAENLLAITRQIDEAETGIVQARAAGDREAETAALRRLQILEQAQAAAQDTLDFGFNANDIEQAISGSRQAIDAVIAKVGEFSDASRDAVRDLEASLDGVGVNLDLGNVADGFGQAGVAAGIEFQKGLDDARRQLEAKLIDPAQFDAAIQKQQDLFEDRIRQLGEIRDVELQIIEERASLEKQRLDDLRSPSQNALVISDVRTEQGASEFLRLASGREDPAIAEYRKQLEQLRKLEIKLEQLATTAVEIVGN